MILNHVETTELYIKFKHVFDYVEPHLEPGWCFKPQYKLLQVKSTSFTHSYSIIEYYMNISRPVKYISLLNF